MRRTSKVRRILFRYVCATYGAFNVSYPIGIGVTSWK